MGNTTYAEKLKNPKWQRRRLEILQRDNFTCTICGDTETELHIHHEKYVGEPWQAPDECLKTTCKNCHAAEHKKDAPVILEEAPKELRKFTGIKELDDIMVQIYAVQEQIRVYKNDDELLTLLQSLIPLNQEKSRIAILHNRSIIM